MDNSVRPPLNTILDSWGPPESIPQRHLDRLSRFCRAHGCVQQTYTQTDTHTHTDRQTDTKTDTHRQTDGQIYTMLHRQQEAAF